MSKLSSFLLGAVVGATAIATVSYFFSKADEDTNLSSDYDDDCDGLEPESGNGVSAEE